MIKTLSPTARRDWARLARTDTIGPVSFSELLRRFGDPTRALANLPDRVRTSGASVPSLADIEAELEAGAALGAHLLLPCDQAYPPDLAALDVPPPLIWALGDIDLLQKPAVAIVGARIASAAGQRFARILAAELGAAGYTVASGLARGVDGAAHEGALATGTIAVLGGGIDDIYPHEHDKLYQQIIETGCILSESRPGHVAQAKDFPRRNRIISGLSRAVVVVEAELRSGSLITARVGAEQGREILAVPGSPLDPRAKGCNDLIRQGAGICEGVDDVLRALEGFRSDYGPPTFGCEDPAAPFDSAPDTFREHVAALLSPTPISRDDVIRAAGGHSGPVLAALAELELAGRIEFTLGGAVATT